VIAEKKSSGRNCKHRHTQKKENGIINALIVIHIIVFPTEYYFGLSINKFDFNVIMNVFISLAKFIIMSLRMLKTLPISVSFCKWIL
jgi:hypothetical protein